MTDDRPEVDVDALTDSFKGARAFRIDTLMKVYRLPREIATAMDTALIEMAWQLDVQAVRDAAADVYCPTCGISHARPIHPWVDEPVHRPDWVDLPDGRNKRKPRG